MKDIFKQPQARHALIAILAVIIGLALFSAGMQLGYRKASFAFRGGDNYYRAVEGRERPGAFAPQQFPDAHGAAGRVVSVGADSLVLEDRDGTDKAVRIDAQTQIKKFRDTINLAQIAVGDNVIIIGAPTDDAQIIARLIRIVPAAPVTSKPSQQ